jgi:hypothetical protein
VVRVSLALAPRSVALLVLCFSCYRLGWCILTCKNIQILFGERDPTKPTVRSVCRKRVCVSCVCVRSVGVSSNPTCLRLWCVAAGSNSLFRQKVDSVGRKEWSRSWRSSFRGILSVVSPLAVSVCALPRRARQLSYGRCFVRSTRVRTRSVLACCCDDKRRPSTMRVLFAWRSFPVEGGATNEYSWAEPKEVCRAQHVH